MIENVHMVVVDDDRLVREFVSATLSYCVNREVLSFENGLDAWLHIHDGSRVDVLVTDVDMPRMDGLALVENVKRHRPEIACIVMSADPEYEAGAELRGADAFLAKPFTLSDLYAVVQCFVVDAPARAVNG
ncbi:MAG: response regulator [Desulfatibacillaceae bacterium]